MQGSSPTLLTANLMHTWMNGAQAVKMHAWPNSLRLCFLHLQLYKGGCIFSSAALQHIG